MRSSIAIIGAGLAGAEVGRSLRQGGYSGRIQMFGREDAVPYERPPLSKKILQGTVDASRLTLGSRESYERNGIELVTGTAVREIDPDAGTVRLDGGDVLGLDTIVLATGAEARRPAIAGADLEGVHVLRTLRDATALRSELEPGSRLVVVGGGYLGLEVAGSARSRGVEVVVVEAAPRVMQRSISPLTASALEARHRAAGIRLLLGTGVDRIEGGTRVERVVTSAGETIGADTVLLAVGAAPAIGLALAAGLPCENGIVVDANGRTAAPNVYAIGDCANCFDPVLDRHNRLEAVNAALMQARRAAADILGNPPPPARAPSFWSEQHDFMVQMAGIPRSGIACDDRLRGDPSSAFAVYRFQEGRLAAVEAVNRPKDFVQATRLIGRPDVTLPQD